MRWEVVDWRWQVNITMPASETKVCQNCKSEFTIEPEDFAFYEKIKVPPPTFCPECRLVRRLVWRNERTFYRRVCDAPGHTESMLTYLAPDKKFPVYDQKYWWSDAWDATEYGQEYDFSRPFFEQLKELMDRVPHSSLSTNYSTMVNSEYSNWAGDLKNCYLVTDADYVEDSGYSSSIFKSKDCYEGNNIANSELCYECVNIYQCYRAFYSIDCQDSSDIYFSNDLIGCSNCFGCFGLRRKSYHIFNEPCAKEAYQQKVAELMGDRSWERMQELWKQAEDAWLRYPHKFRRGLHNVNVSGDYIEHSKNTRQAYFVADVEDSKFVALIHSPGTKDCYDYTDWGDNAQRLYECLAVGLGASNIKFSSLVVVQTKDSSYSWWCINCSDVFGCASLRKKQYCILNKQYTKEEYEALVPKIIEHMNAMPYVKEVKNEKGEVRKMEYRYGEFFPPELSPFDYNETPAQEFFPLTEEEARAKGFRWQKPQEKAYAISKEPADLPAIARETSDTITEEIIGCRHKGACNHPCTTAFKIIPQELQFYRRMSIPLPHLCPNCRHVERLRHRNPMRLWQRGCDCGDAKGLVYKNTVEHFHGAEPCPNEFETSYAPDPSPTESFWRGPEIVYCEQCYQAEVA